MSLTTLQITLAPALPADFLTIANLEASAFAKDDFTAVAFGPLRSSNEAMEDRAAGLAAKPKAGERVRNVKAVMALEGREEIEGFANWYFCVGRTGSEEERVRLGVKAGWKKGNEGEETYEKKDVGGEEKNPWGPGANISFCEDVLGKGDVYMARATEGWDYASESPGFTSSSPLNHLKKRPGSCKTELTTLVVSPSQQRRGIGTLLFEAFLAETDEAGLQAVLGASPEGIELYRRHGFVDFETMEIELGEYEGGKEMEAVRHVIMYRSKVAK